MPILSKKRLHQLGDLLHQLEVRKQDEGFAVRQLHEMLDPVDQRVAITLGARVGHFTDHEQLHLPLVIEWRADLQTLGRLRPDSAGEVK